MKNEKNWTKDNIGSQAGKTAIVTGANIGIGFETALGLYEAGAHVILACRSLENAEKALGEMKQKGVKGTLETGLLDLSDLGSVKILLKIFFKITTAWIF